MVFFGLNTWLLVLLLAGILFGATATGLVLGRVMGARSEGLREPFGVLQGALVGFMGLVLAFGLSLAVDGTNPAGPTWSPRRMRSGRPTSGRRRWLSRSGRSPWPCSGVTRRTASRSPTPFPAVPNRAAPAATAGSTNGGCGPSPGNLSTGPPWRAPPASTWRR